MQYQICNVNNCYYYKYNTGRDFFFIQGGKKCLTFLEVRKGALRVSLLKMSVSTVGARVRGEKLQQKDKKMREKIKKKNEICDSSVQR